jgi:hypothetical protein
MSAEDSATVTWCATLPKRSETGEGSVLRVCVGLRAEHVAAVYFDSHHVLRKRGTSLHEFCVLRDHHVSLDTKPAVLSPDSLLSRVQLGASVDPRRTSTDSGLYRGIPLTARHGAATSNCRLQWALAA